MKTKLFFIVLILLLIFVPSLFLNVRQTPEFEFDNEKRLNKNLINLTKKYPKVKFNINYYIENELLGEEKDKQKIKEVYKIKVNYVAEVLPIVSINLFAF